MNTLAFPDGDQPTVIKRAAAHKPFALRDYQRADCDAILREWNAGKRGVVCRHSTGLGKSVAIAELCRLVTQGRILVLVDVGSLATDLNRTIITHTGEVPGILTGPFKAHWDHARIVVATVQSMYAGEQTAERFREFDPMQFGTIIIDECESSIAERYSETIEYFRAVNPAIKIVGLTATPFRSDGRGMAELYDYAATEPGELNRDILWSVTNGWLVKPRQGFVRCKLDFSTLKLRKQADGGKDFSDDDIADLMSNQDEVQWREMAESIHKAANGKQSIVMCPNSVEIAKVVASHLCGAAGNLKAARAVYGAQGEEANEEMDRFKNGEFSYIVAVKKLEKGFDYDQVRCLFLLRKTKSRRLYEQFLGRGARPLVSVRAALNAESDPAKRMKIIAESEKPYFVLFDLVGVHPDVKDLGVIDILGSKHCTEAERERIKDKQLEDGFDDDGNPIEPEDLGDQAREVKADIRAEAEAKLERERQERERQRRIAIDIQSHVEVEVFDNFGATGGAPAGMPTKSGGATGGQVRYLIAFGVPAEKAMAYSKGQAGAVIDSYTRRNAPLNWGPVNAFEAKMITVNPAMCKPQRAQLSKLAALGWKGEKPKNARDANLIIKRLESPL